MYMMSYSCYAVRILSWFFGMLLLLSTTNASPTSLDSFLQDSRVPSWTVERLTTSGANVQPSLSPDGRRLAFYRIPGQIEEYSNGFLYLMDRPSRAVKQVGRLPTLVEFSGRPIWTDDSREVVYSANESLWIYNLEKKSSRRLTPRHLDASFPSLHPDGHRIAFWSLKRIRSEAVIDLRVVDLRTGSLKRIYRFNYTPETEWPIRAPVWSSDGRFLAATVPDDPKGVDCVNFQMYVFELTPLRIVGTLKCRIPIRFLENNICYTATIDRKGIAAVEQYDPRIARRVIVGTLQNIKGVTVTSKGEVIYSSRDGLYLFNPATQSPEKISDFGTQPLWSDRAKALLFVRDLVTGDQFDSDIYIAWRE